ncbi:MAG: glycine/sarcosine/betaine reductase selenoprotein B family protein [Alphaproteobacteria bacterium]|nr:glycine/sarcosine/betaine reductase selenoprotein B family protein [Alphaproteobacteria bacterium]MDP6811646.1 glycine/sarcosine/betaine reductase selenoprotein B family protein [Alphaproteobacteria bacterium]
MSVDSFKYLPKSFRPMFEDVDIEVEGAVWAPFEKPLSEATIAVLSSAGIFLKDSQQGFDMEREKREPTWGDPSWRAIPRDVGQDRIDAAHLHINTEHVKRDVGVALPLRALAALEADGVIGRLAAENYSVMGYQENGCAVWQSQTGPEIVNRLRHEAVDALILAPA